MDYNLTSEALQFYVKHLRTRFFYKWVQYTKEKKQLAAQLKIQTDKALLFFVRWRLGSCIRHWITFVYETLPQMVLYAEEYHTAMLNRIAFNCWKHRYVHNISMCIRACEHYRQTKMPIMLNLLSLWRTAANAQQIVKIYTYADNYWITRMVTIAFTAWHMKFSFILSLQPMLHHLTNRILHVLKADAFWSLKEAYQKAHQRRKDVQEAMEYYSAQKTTWLLRYIIEQGIGFVRAEDARRAAIVAKKAEEAYLHDIFKDRKSLLDSFHVSSVPYVEPGSSKIDHHTTEPADLTLPKPIHAITRLKKADNKPRVMSTNSTTGVRQKTTEQLVQDTAPQSNTNTKSRSKTSHALIAQRAQPRTLQKAQHGRTSALSNLQYPDLDIPKDMSIYSCTEEISQQAQLSGDEERLLTQYIDSYDIVLKELRDINSQIKLTETAINSKTAELTTTPYPQTMQLEIISLKMQMEELSAQLEHKNAQAETLRVILSDYKSKLIS